jgi:hypothetical protein
MNDAEGATLTSLHDATLLDITIQWVHAKVTFSFRTVPGVRHDLVVDGVTALQLTRLEPWGPSRSVNQASWRRRGSDMLVDLCIEMQSGDLIEVRAREFTLTEPPAHRG